MEHSLRLGKNKTEQVIEATSLRETQILHLFVLLGAPTRIESQTPWRTYY